MKSSWFSHCLILSIISYGWFFPAGSHAQSEEAVHVSARVPVQASSRELSAQRPTSIYHASATKPSQSAHHWQQQASLPGTVIHDISFPTPKIGYAAAELGQVWKTIDGGVHWTEIMNLGSPYYWYGVKAMNTKDVIISGFYDSSTFEGLIRWSHDGGATWTSDIVLTNTGWVQRPRFANSNDGLIMDLVDGSTNAAQYTTNGGQAASDWTTVEDNPDGGWFGLEFSFLHNLHARASGINYCDSTNGGAKWNCGPSIDSVFDGETFFVNDRVGWVAGGEISPAVEGWVHRTTDGGKTWSGRTLDDPWPIREVYFLTPKTGWAAGGNLYTQVGGIYFSKDGGKTWSLDVDTHAEMDACDSQRVGGKTQIWCAGYGYPAEFTGVIYTLKGIAAK